VRKYAQYICFALYALANTWHLLANCDIVTRPSAPWLLPHNLNRMILPVPTLQAGLITPHNSDPINGYFVAQRWHITRGESLAQISAGELLGSWDPWSIKADTLYLLLIQLAMCDNYSNESLALYTVQPSVFINSYISVWLHSPRGPWSYTQSAELLVRGISPSQGLYLHT
jgi:hypothetical protein